MTVRLRILVVTDHETADRRALARGAELSAYVGGDLTIFASGPSHDPEGLVDRRHQLFHRLSALGALARADVHVVPGDVTALGREFAVCWPADLVVIDGGVARPETVRSLVETLNCPLLIVRSDQAGPYGRVLVGVDLADQTATDQTAAAQMTAGLAAATAVAPTARYLVLHAAPVPAGIDRDVVGGVAANRIEWRPRHGLQPGEIVDAAREGQIDLVALGRPRRTGPSGPAPGAASCGIIGALSCDVVVARG